MKNIRLSMRKSYKITKIQFMTYIFRKIQPDIKQPERDKNFFKMSLLLLLEENEHYQKCLILFKIVCFSRNAAPSLSDKAPLMSSNVSASSTA